MTWGVAPAHPSPQSTLARPNTRVLKMTETIGVLILGVGFAGTMPAFVYLVMRLLRRQAPSPTVTLWRREREPTKRQHQTKH